MRQRSKPIKEKTSDKPTDKLQQPKKRVKPERKKIRQLLRSMLPMEEDQRQLKEEQNLFR
jgi:hypothetical protein